MTKPRVGVVMGSASDWEVMRHAVAQLENLDISYQAKLVSAHRTPDLLFEYAEQAELREFARAIQTRSEDGSAHASAGRHAGHPGGRQLGRMFVVAVRKMGYKVIVLDPEQNSPATQMANEHICTPAWSTLYPCAGDSGADRHWRGRPCWFRSHRVWRRAA